MPRHITIQKHPALQPAEDFWALRREGMALIEALAHEEWTDYNIHDPGVTLLEALCYALTDLGYRTAFPVAQLLAPPPGSGYTPDRQGFFTARRALTTAPWTVEDYRKLLIDLPGIRNAWLFPKTCPPDGIFLYANCKDEALQYLPTEHPIIVRGLWDVLVEFDEDENGDLNSDWQQHQASADGVSGPLPLSIELQLPTPGEAAARGEDFQLFRKARRVTGVEVLFISGNKGDDTNIPQRALARALRRPLFTTLRVDYVGEDDSSKSLTLTDVPTRVRLTRDADREVLRVEDLAAVLENTAPGALFPAYLKRLRRADDALRDVRETLGAARNLCEDWDRITAVPVQEVSVCADIDVAPDADIEAVLAEAFTAIDEYFSPVVRFHALESLLEAGDAVEDIFNGPAMRHGFLRTEEVRATGLKKVLQASDVINLLMSIPGVLAVRNFSFGAYDETGKHDRSEPWTLTVTPQHQPRLYLAGSKFLVFKSGLPFLPASGELTDTLRVIRAERTTLRNPGGSLDLPVPEVAYAAPPEYEPVMNALPRTYSVGLAGLPAGASALRTAQALQLKGYLLPFEQMLANHLASLQTVHNLFALDESVDHTYTATTLTEAILPGYAGYKAVLDGTPDAEVPELLNSSVITDLEILYGGADRTPTTRDELQALAEDRPTFLDRRNRFLDAMLARFGESFAEYALVLHDNLNSGRRTQEVLIEDKIRFLKELPERTARRGQAADRTLRPSPSAAGNEAGLQSRLERLLGFRAASQYFELYEERDTDGVAYERRWRLKDDDEKLLLSGSTRYVHESLEKASAKAQAEIALVVRHATNIARYTVTKTRHKTDKWSFSLTDETGEIIATRKQAFPTQAAAKAAIDVVVDFAKNRLLAERLFIVEHVLLRPHNRPADPLPEGDPLLPICVGPDCTLCGEEDPYSFRMTVVLNGATGGTAEDIAMRRFAERTIRQEAPAHLGVKVCWAGPEQLILFENAWCAWLEEGARSAPDAALLQQRLKELIEIFTDLKSVYPSASLHDCVDGDDNNRVFLNHTII